VFSSHSLRAASSNTCACCFGFFCRSPPVAIQHSLAHPLGCSRSHRHESAGHAACSDACRRSGCCLSCATRFTMQSCTTGSHSCRRIHDVRHQISL
jgi:hypothetical protein